jgi:hypothetical protein
MNQGVADDVLERANPQRHIISYLDAVRSYREGGRHVPDAADHNSLSIPVSRPKVSSFEGSGGRSQKDVVS